MSTIANFLGDFLIFGVGFTLGFIVGMGPTDSDDDDNMGGSA